MGKIHEVFPLIVYQGSIETHKEFKEKYIEELREYWFDGYQNESPECSGRIFLHLNPNYKIFFDQLKYNIDEYFNCLNVDHSKLNYHVIKSWVGYHQTDETPSINPHYHNESNISFVYYVKTDETSDKLVVQQHNNRNQVIGGLFETAEKHNMILGYNKYNCNFYRITPTEGSVIIFPSETYHFTQKEKKRVGERLVIAGDVRITLKEECDFYHQGSTHPSQWKQI